MFNILSFIIAAMLFSQNVYSQPKSVEYEKEYDFFLNVLVNPNLRIYDFLAAGLNSKNTEFHDFSAYYHSENTQNKCKKLKINIREAYNKAAAAWRVFLEVEHTDLDEFGQYMISYHRDNIFAPRNCPDPELKHKLSIVPLKLERY